MRKSEASGQSIGVWLVVGLFATTAGFVGWILGARSGKRQYRHLVKGVEHLLQQAQENAQEAQDAVRERADDLTDTVRDNATQARRKVRRKAKKARR